LVLPLDKLISHDIDKDVPGHLRYGLASPLGCVPEQFVEGFGDAKSEKAFAVGL
jgi:hypothetical protein